jgi:hypothetical protein
MANSSNKTSTQPTINVYTPSVNIENNTNIENVEIKTVKEDSTAKEIAKKVAIGLGVSAGAAVLGIPYYSA